MWKACAPAGSPLIPRLNQHAARTLREGHRAHLRAVRAAHHRRGGLTDDIMVDSLGDAQRTAGVPLAPRPHRARGIAAPADAALQRCP